MFCRMKGTQGQGPPAQIVGQQTWPCDTFDIHKAKNERI